MPIRNIVGPVPDPDELYGRDRLIRTLWTQIEGNNILLLAPRRFGKTGVMRHVLLRPHEEYLPVYFDLEDVAEPEEFLWRVTQQLLANSKLRHILSSARGLPATISGWIKDNFDEVEFEGAKVTFKEAMKKHWREAARRMMLEMEHADRTVIFIFDEMPAMLEKMIDACGEPVAHEFLAWFRTVRLEQKDVLRRHRFIVAGSIGIDAILRRLNAPDKLNDFQRLYVEPLPDEVARQLAGDLARSLGVRWDDSLTNRLFELIGPPVPYFIHLFFSQLAQLPAGARETLSATDLSGVYQRQILGPTCKSYFDHYSTRLKRAGKTVEKCSIAILRVIAGEETGRVSRSELFGVYRKARGRGAGDVEFDELLADLEHDWYVVLDPMTNEYHFMLKLMQDWWRRWYPPAVRAAATSVVCHK